MTSGASSSMARRGPQLAVLVLFGAFAALALVDLDRPFGNGDEVIYAENAREMRATASFGELHWQGALVLQRPAAPFAVAAASEAIIGGERGLRLPSALAHLATLALVYAAAFACFRRRDGAAIATLLCAGAPSFQLFDRALLSDPSFVLGLTLAVAGTARALAAEVTPRAARRALLAAAAGLGLAVACKSLAAAIPALALAPWLLIAARRHADRRTVLLGVALFVALAAPFYGLGFARYGARFWHEHVGYSLLARARGDLAVGMPGGVLAYVDYLAAIDGVAVAAWIAIALLGGVALGVTSGQRATAVAASPSPSRTPRVSPLLAVAAYALAVLVGLSLVGTRLPHYLLPVYPAAAIALAGVWAALISRLPAPRRAAAGGLAVGAAIAVAATGLARLDLPAQHFLPSPETVALGRAAGAEAAAGEPVIALDWYAPALGYYADRPVILATRSPALYAVMNDVDFFHAAGAARLVPPAPAPPGTDVLVAGPQAALAAAPWLGDPRVVASAGDYLLVRARVIDPVR